MDDLFTLSTLIDESLENPSVSRFLTAGGGVLLLAFLIEAAQQVYKMLTGGKPEWLSPFIRLIGFAALLTSYSLVVSWTVGIVGSFGKLDASTDSVEAVFLERYSSFQNIREGIHEDHAESRESYPCGPNKVCYRDVGEPEEGKSDSWFLGLNFDSLKLGLLQTITELTYAFTISIIYLMKHLQHYLLLVIINFGPVLIGFAAIHRFFHPLALSWFWSLVEVSAWGWTMSLLVQALSKVPASISTSSASLSTMMQHMVSNMTFAVLLMSVPLITAMLVRGQTATGIGQRAAMLTMAGMMAGLSGVKGTGQAGARGISSAVGGAGPASSAASRAAGGGAGQGGRSGGGSGRSDDPSGGGGGAPSPFKSSDPKKRAQAHAIKRNSQQRSDD